MPAGTPLASRAVAPVMLGRCGWAMMNFGLITWGPSYLAQARGFDLKQLGGAMAVIFICGFLGSLTAGFGADALQLRGLPRSLVLKAMLCLSGLGVLGAFLLLPTIADPAAAVALLSGTVFLLCFGMSTAHAQSAQTDDCASFSDEDVSKVTAMAANLMSKPPQGPDGVKDAKRDALRPPRSARQRLTRYSL